MPSSNTVGDAVPSRRRFLQAVGVAAGSPLRSSIALGADGSSPEGDDLVDAIEAAALPLSLGVPDFTEYVPDLTAEPDDGKTPPREPRLVAPLAETLSAYPIVGLGEATHGTHEFHAIRRQLVQELVAEHGLRVVAFEDQFSTVVDANQYVLHGDRTLRDAMRGFEFWVWRTGEVERLLAWLREFNRERPREDRVEVHGFDCQATAPPAAGVRSYLDDVGATGISDAADVLDAIASSSAREHFLDDDRIARPDRIEAANRAVATVREHLKANREAYECRTSTRAFEIALRHLRTLEQAVAQLDGGSGHSDGRDEGMAENSSWLLETFDTEQVALWGHNAHLQATGDTADPQGSVLRQRHGDDYYALGFEFGSGSFRAITDRYPGVDEGTIEEPPSGAASQLADVAYDEFYLDFRTASEHELVAEWLGDRQQFPQYGAVFNSPHSRSVRRLDEAWNGLVFVAESTPTVSHILGGVDDDPLEGDG